MDGEQRRNEIMKRLQKADTPVSAGRLAQMLGVSRQLVVGDVALLRAGGLPVTATPRGYVLETAAPTGILCTVACRHNAAQIADELYTVVDCGCSVVNVIVEHAVYGQLTGNLQIASRYDADLFCAALAQHAAQPLCSLTGDIHLHTLLCPAPAQQTAVLKALRDKGYLAEEHFA